MGLLAVYLDGIHYRQELVKCGKPGCKVCKGGPAHGPYWYSYQTVGVYQRKKYVGRLLPDAVLKLADPVKPGYCHAPRGEFLRIRGLQ